METTISYNIMLHTSWNLGLTMYGNQPSRTRRGDLRSAVQLRMQSMQACYRQAKPIFLPRASQGRVQEKCKASQTPQCELPTELFGCPCAALGVHVLLNNYCYNFTSCCYCFHYHFTTSQVQYYHHSSLPDGSLADSDLVDPRLFPNLIPHFRQPREKKISAPVYQDPPHITLYNPSKSRNGNHSFLLTFVHCPYTAPL